MPGSRSAPTVDGTPTTSSLSMSWFDADDGETTVTQLVDPTSTNVEFEAAAAAAQAMSNASLFQIDVVQSYKGIGLASNALSDDYVSVKDAIRLSNKQLASGAYIRAYVPAPLGPLILPGPIVDTTDATYITWRDAIVAILPTGFALLNTGFVQNVARNKGVSPIAS